MGLLVAVFWLFMAAAFICALFFSIILEHRERFDADGKPREQGCMNQYEIVVENRGFCIGRYNSDRE
jgi:hypothetical protein